MSGSCNFIDIVDVEKILTISHKRFISEFKYKAIFWELESPARIILLSSRNKLLRLEEISEGSETCIKMELTKEFH